MPPKKKVQSHWVKPITSCARSSSATASSGVQAMTRHSSTMRSMSRRSWPTCAPDGVVEIRLVGPHAVERVGGRPDIAAPAPCARSRAPRACSRRARTDNASRCAIGRPDGRPWPRRRGRACCCATSVLDAAIGDGEDAVALLARPFEARRRARSTRARSADAGAARAAATPRRFS